MEIVYRTKELRRCAEEPGYARRVLGAEQAKVFLRRIYALSNASSFEILRNAQGRFHELRHNRKGQWGFDLNGPYRLIVTPLEDPIPVNAQGGFDWRAIHGAVVVEIVNYHKEGG